MLHSPCARSSTIEKTRWNTIGNAKILIPLRLLYWNARGQKESDGALLDHPFCVSVRLHQRCCLPYGFHDFAGNITSPSRAFCCQSGGNAGYTCFYNSFPMLWVVYNGVIFCQPTVTGSRNPSPFHVICISTERVSNVRRHYL